MANPEICGFVCLNDNTALSCYSACEQLGYTDQIIIGFDGSPAGKQSIADGQLTATMVYSPIDLANSALEVAKSVCSGGEYEKESQVDMWMISSENIEEFDLESWS